MGESLQQQQQQQQPHHENDETSSLPSPSIIPISNLSTRAVVDNRVQVPVSSSSSSSASFDAVVVGGGIMGACIAHDLASSGYTVAVIEQDDQVGGVWRCNKYPGLRLQGINPAWRCLSLAPPFHQQQQRPQPQPQPLEPKRNEATGTTENTTMSSDSTMLSPSSLSSQRLLYRPFAKEILAYIQQMLEHPNITTYTNTKYEGRVVEQAGNKTSSSNNSNNNNNNHFHCPRHIAKLRTTMTVTTNNSRPRSSSSHSWLSVSPSSYFSFLSSFFFGGTKKTATSTTASATASTTTTVAAKAIILAVGYDTHRSGKPYLPINPMTVTNGAHILHSSEVPPPPPVVVSNTNSNSNSNSNTNTPLIGNNNASSTTKYGKITYVVGQQKAAIEILQQLSPRDVIWVIRGGGGGGSETRNTTATFVKREAIEEEIIMSTKREQQPASWIVSRIVRIVPLLSYYGQFQIAETILMQLGLGIRVDENNDEDNKDTNIDTNRHKPTFRGGIVTDGDMVHARKFPQMVITDMVVDPHHHALILKKKKNGKTNNSNLGAPTDHHNDAENDLDVVVRPQDRVIFCTGQRTGQSIESYMETALTHCSDGLFMALPYSNQACSASAYTTKLALDYLDTHANTGNTAALPSSSLASYYSSGNFKASLSALADHLKNQQDTTNNNNNNNDNSGNTTTNRSGSSDEWSKVMIMLYGINLKISEKILPNIRGDLSMIPYWTSERVFGHNLNARQTLQEFAQPDYGGYYTFATMSALTVMISLTRRRATIRTKVVSWWPLSSSK